MTNFNKKDKGRFQKLVKAIEEIGIHKKCGIVIVNPPETVKNNARRFVSEKLETKGLTISSPQSQKPTKISEFVYDTNVELTEPTDTNDELTEPTVKEDYSWDSWKASNQGYLTAENFWQFLKDLAIHGKDVLYPCGIDATLIDEGKNVKPCGNNINFSSTGW